MNCTRTSISVPKATRDRMDQANGQFNWSKIATEAFENTLALDSDTTGTVTLSARRWKRTQKRLIELESKLKELESQLEKIKKIVQG